MEEIMHLGIKFMAQTWPNVRVTFGVLCVHMMDGHFL
jgi:hypothetical protein